MSNVSASSFLICDDNDIYFVGALNIITTLDVENNFQHFPMIRDGLFPVYAIAKDKFYYYNHNTSSSDAYESFKFVNRLSAPLLRKRPRIADWGRCQAPFEYRAMRADSTGYEAKIY